MRERLNEMILPTPQVAKTEEDKVEEEPLNSDDDLPSGLLTR